ncbi:MAG: hypothetical protein LBW85_05515 [Deltaproteobacteria bacterium]|nr:hypothetical protein [Deltaproteobacteria bacterium]
MLGHSPAGPRESLGRPSEAPGKGRRAEPEGAAAFRGPTAPFPRGGLSLCVDRLPSLQAAALAKYLSGGFRF